MKQATVKIESNGPMLMHSDKLANPLNPMTKAHKLLTSKRKKTDEDHEAIARSEWLGGLYYDEDIGIHIPVQNLRKSLIMGARFNKLGRHIERGVVFSADKIKLQYDGPRNPEKLWLDMRFVDARSVVVNRARIMRYRPLFTKWMLSPVEMFYDPAVIDLADILNSFEQAGAMVGLGDYRPLFGKYTVTKI